jgi:hypothetical protein
MESLVRIPLSLKHPNGASNVIASGHVRPASQKQSCQLSILSSTAYPHRVAIRAIDLMTGYSGESLWSERALKKKPLCSGSDE